MSNTGTATVAPVEVTAQTTPLSFTGEKTAWYGFDRFDFLMDEANSAIKPFELRLTRERESILKSRARFAVSWSFRMNRPLENRGRGEGVISIMSRKPKSNYSVAVFTSDSSVRRYQALGGMVYVSYGTTRPVD